MEKLLPQHGPCQGAADAYRQVIISESLKLLNCDRISLFVYDKRIEMRLDHLNRLQTAHDLAHMPHQARAERL